MGDRNISALGEDVRLLLRFSRYRRRLNLASRRHRQGEKLTRMENFPHGAQAI